jgi:hypothetical protein
MHHMGDLGGAQVEEAETHVSPGGTGGAVRGSKGAQTGRGRLQCEFSARAGGEEGRCAAVEGKVQEAKPRGAQG